MTCILHNYLQSFNNCKQKIALVQNWKSWVRFLNALFYSLFDAFCLFEVCIVHSYGLGHHQCPQPCGWCAGKHFCTHNLHAMVLGYPYYFSALTTTALNGPVVASYSSLPLQVM